MAEMPSGRASVLVAVHDGEAVTKIRVCAPECSCMCATMVAEDCLVFTS